MLVEEFGFVLSRHGSLDHDLARGIPWNDAFLHRIKQSSLDLMVEIHDCLALMVFREDIEQLLIFDSRDATQGQSGCKLQQMLVCQLVFAEGDIGHRSFLVHLHPVMEVRRQILVLMHDYLSTVTHTATVETG